MHFETQSNELLETETPIIAPKRINTVTKSYTKTVLMFLLQKLSILQMK